MAGAELGASGGDEPPATPSAERRDPSGPSLEVVQRLMGDAAARYETIGLLGTGDTGSVHSCADLVLGRRVAMKRSSPGVARDDAAARRFLAEARVQGRLEHPSIVPVYELGLRDGQPYFTMKSIEGRSLRELLTLHAGGDEDTVINYSRRRLLTAFVAVCQAVDFAHSRGVIHRDLNPENIMLGGFGEVYVLDWGSARVSGHPEDDGAGAREDHNADHAVSTARVGAVGYMAPEQYRGDDEQLGPHSDVYALGATLFELLTFTRLNRGRTTEERAASMFARFNLHDAAKDSGRLVPAELLDLCERATAFDVAHRLDSAGAMVVELERFLDGERNEALRLRASAEHTATAARILTGADGDEVFDSLYSWPSVNVSASATALVPELDPELERRRLALRELGRALALNPANEEALRAMLELLTAPVASSPPEVAEEMRATEQRLLRLSGLIAGFTYLALWLHLPLMLWAGLREPTPLAVFFGLSSLCALFAFVALKQKRPRPLVMTTMVLSQVAMAMTTVILGPLLLMPALIAANTAGYALALDRRGRGVTLLFGLLAMTIPFALELAGLVAPSYQFTGDAVVVRAYALEFIRAPTTAFLGLTNLALLLVTVLPAGRLRDALRTAEERQHVMAWHFKQLAPELSGAPRQQS